jgi:glycosyltransferase involved in cell wall biosynthesis
MNITFVIPGDNRSGGVRVTVAMANELIKRGHRVRITSPKNPFRFSWESCRLLFRRKMATRFGLDRTGWLHGFKGTVEAFHELSELSFADREIVIAVGTFTIDHVFHLQANVVKVRYNHGLLANMTAEERWLWSLPMPTLTVARSLCQELQQITGEKVRAVVPNGIDPNEYYVLPELPRTGIGTIYGQHPAKAPQDIVTVLAECRRRWPDLPQNIFGVDPVPPALRHADYHRYPSVAEARECYNRSMIWLVLSRSEGFAMPLLEAMACGCAVISTDTHGGTELISDRINGILVPRGDCGAAVDQVGSLLGNRTLCKQLADAGQQTVRRFSWSEAGSQMEQALANLA